MRPALAVLLLALLAPEPARAWLTEGHLATGAIAFDVLQAHDPAAADVAVRVMAAHPDRPFFDRDLGGRTGAARNRRLFELMAIWPDVARGGPLDHDDWHYDQAFASPIRHLVPFSFGGAVAAFRRNLRTVRDRGAPDRERALALCWVMHIVGDMHQPLHAALWLSWRFPVSDAGGNWAWVRAAPDAPPQRLHFFWDGAGRPGGLSRNSPDAWVRELEAEHPSGTEPPPVDPERAFDGWVAETRALAFTDVYRAGAFRPGRSERHAPVLSPAYVARARQAGAERIARAGNRIGALLAGLR